MRYPVPKPILLKVLRWVVDRLHYIADVDSDEPLEAEAIRYTAGRLAVDIDRLAEEIKAQKA